MNGEKNMLRLRTKHTLPHFLPLLLVSILSCMLYGQGFYDDFSDGSATDGDPVAWDPSWSGATIDVVDESLIISEREFASVWTPDRYTDVSIRAQMRLLEGDAVAIQTRITIGAPVSNYYGTLMQDGLLYLGGNSPTGFIDLGQIATSLTPAEEDVMMRMDVAGPEIKLWAWSADDEMPIDPLLSTVDERGIFGFAGVAVGSEGDLPCSAAVRFIEVIPIPEPSSSILFFLGLLGLLSCRRCR